MKSSFRGFNVRIAVLITGEVYVTPSLLKVLSEKEIAIRLCARGVMARVTALAISAELSFENGFLTSENTKVFNALNEINGIFFKYAVWATIGSLSLIQISGLKSSMTFLISPICKKFFGKSSILE